MARLGRIIAGCILLMLATACQTYPRVEVTAGVPSLEAPTSAQSGVLH